MVRNLRNYITSSLLNSWLFNTSEYGDINNFISYLNKEPKEQTEAMLKGIEFENECYDGKHEHIQKYIKNGLYQVECRKIYKDILIFGYADVLTYDTIYDIKRVKSYKLGKYYNTSQHKIYCYCLGLDKFAYLVQAKDEDKNNFFVEHYDYKQGQAEQLIDQFIDWLRVTGYYKIWKERWAIVTGKQIGRAHV